jgi:hypothetical protein
MIKYMGGGKGLVGVGAYSKLVVQLITYFYDR